MNKNVFKIDENDNVVVQFMDTRISRAALLSLNTMNEFGIPYEKEKLTLFFDAWQKSNDFNIQQDDWDFYRFLYDFLDTLEFANLSELEKPVKKERQKLLDEIESCVKKCDDIQDEYTKYINNDKSEKTENVNSEKNMERSVYESYKMCFENDEIKVHRKRIIDALISIIHESELNNIELREPTYELIRLLEFVQNIEENIE